MIRKQKLFANRVSEMRGEESQRALSKRIGVDRSTLVRYESGLGNPRMTRLWELADRFNVTMDWLAGRESD